MTRNERFVKSDEHRFILAQAALSFGDVTRRGTDGHRRSARASANITGGTPMSQMRSLESGLMIIDSPRHSWKQGRRTR